MARQNWVPGANMTFHQILEAFRTAIEGRDVKDKMYWTVKYMVDTFSKEGNANFDVEMAKGVFATLKDRLDAGDEQVDDINSDIRNFNTNWINWNLGKIGPEGITEELFEMMHNNLPINMIPTDNSITDIKLVDSTISLKKMQIVNGALAPTMTNINVDTVNKKIIVPTDNLFVADNKNFIIPAQTLDYSSSLFPGYVQFVYFNPATQRLHVSNAMETLPNTKLYYLFAYYQDILIGGNYKITVNGKFFQAVNGADIAKGSIPHDKMMNPFAYILLNNSIEINFQTKKVTVKRDVLLTNGQNNAGNIPFGYGSIDFPEDFSLSATTFKIWVDVAASKLVMGKVTDNSGGNPIIAITYNGDIVTMSPHAIYKVDSNGKRQRKVGEILDGTADDYNWGNNRIIMPTNLYFLTDVDYSIATQNFNSETLIDHDDILYEMVTPNKTVTFENTGHISSPIACDFETYLAGIYNANTTSDVRLKDVTMHFADPVTKSNKTPKILHIGDSIVHAGAATNEKIWLDKFGFNPTYLGTTSEYNSFGYGIKGLAYEKGEGYSGWRLTDFTGNTRNTSGDIIYRSETNAFLNPTTLDFDFTYYMTSNGYTEVDFVTIRLGTNDISGNHQDPNAVKPTIEDILTYMPVELQKMIDSIHAFDPAIKIGLVPPTTVGAYYAYNERFMRYTEKMIETFEEATPNVYVLANYLGNGRLSGKSWGYYTDEIPLGQTAITTDFHDNGSNLLVNSLWSASWIINMLD